MMHPAHCLKKKKKKSKVVVVHNTDWAINNREIESERIRSPSLTFEQHCELCDQILKDK
jgi:hypothetical protein